MPVLGDLGTVDIERDPFDLGLEIDELRVFVGYTGWSAGQLESELEQGAWFVVRALPADPFTSEPAALWRERPAPPARPPRHIRELPERSIRELTPLRTGVSGVPAHVGHSHRIVLLWHYVHMDWITEATVHVAAACGIDPAELLLDARDAETLLDLAGVAAHASGARTNAPLLCHVLGRAIAAGASMDDLASAVHEFAGK